MRTPLILIIALSALGCATTTPRSAAPHNVYAPAGGPLFTFFKDVRTHTSRGLWKWDGETDGPVRDRSTSTSREVKYTWVVRTDPRTGERTSYGRVAADAQVFFWDAARKVLWVSVWFSAGRLTLDDLLYGRTDNDHARIVGLVEGGFVWPVDPAGSHRYFAEVRYRKLLSVLPELPAPLAWGDGGMLWNAVHNAAVAIPGLLAVPDYTIDRTRQAFHDGERTRIVEWPRTSLLGEVSPVIQTTQVLWNASGPPRATSHVWRLPPPDPNYAMRRAVTVTADGGHVVELLEGTSGRQARVHDATGAAVQAITLSATPGDPAYQAHHHSSDNKYVIEPGWGDTVLIGDWDGACLNGGVLRANAKIYHPIERCMERSPAYGVINIGGQYSAVLPDGTLAVVPSSAKELSSQAGFTTFSTGGVIEGFVDLEHGTWITPTAAIDWRRESLIEQEALRPAVDVVLDGATRRTVAIPQRDEGQAKTFFPDTW